MNDTEVVKQELEKVNLHFPEGCTNEQLLDKLAAHIDYLIVNDFSMLISLLYRLDVSESKLTQLINSARDVSAGEIIAGLIIERQLQKVEARKSFKAQDDIPEEEKW